MRGFYVDLVRGKRVAFLAGPFLSEPIARKYERAAVQKAMEMDPWAHFDPHGVVALDFAKHPEIPPPVGKVNHLIEIDPADLLGIPPRLPAPAFNGAPGGYAVAIAEQEESEAR